MKYYQDLATMPTFTYFDASKIIDNEAQISKKLNAMLKEGSIHRIKQNLYTCVNFATGDDYATRFQVASNINEDSFVSFHTAFEFYGFYNQSYFEVQVCSTKRFSNFSYQDYNYKGFLTKSLAQIDLIQGVRISSIERTIVDSINMLGKVMDAEELVKCLSLIHRVNEKKILEILSIYNRELLYRKVGYVLSFYKEEFSISDSFFKTCLEKGSPLNKGFLIPSQKNELEYIPSWGLYAYHNLKSLASIPPLDANDFKLCIS